MKTIAKIAAALLIAAVVAVAAWLGWFLTAQKKFTRACGACHEMRLRRDNLALARHDGMECGACHDMTSVLTMARLKIAGGPNLFKDVNVPNAKCVKCHKHVEDRKIFYRDVDFSHKTHLEKKIDCSTCHKKFVHRKSRSDEYIALRQCRECHERKRRHHKPPTAIADLGELEKQPHKPDWYVDHKHIGKAEEKACAECHSRDYCKSCHDNYATHLKSWWANHYQDAMIRLAECQICHRPDYCVSCHKKAVPKNHDDKWGASHWENVDLTTCNQCHTLNFCKTCHTRKAPTSHSSIKDHAGMKPEREKQCGVCHGEKSCETCHHGPQRTESSCMSCHRDILSVRPRVNGRVLSLRDHVEKHGVTCRQCHPSTTADGKYTSVTDCNTCHHRTQGRKCGTCHKGQTREIDSGGMDFECGFCHKAGDREFAAPRTKCLSCHALMFREEAQAHGSHSCVKCHQPHTWKAKPASSCKGCHMDDLKKHKGGVDDCMKCHGPHTWAARGG